MNGYAYLLDIRQFNASNIELASALVTTERRKKAEVYLDRGDRCTSIGAGLLLQYLLKTYYLGNFVVSYSETGKPMIIGQKGIFVSLSHSGWYCACAISDTPIGIDIQQHCGEFPLIINHFFTNVEKIYLESFPEDERQKQFYKLWCRKEAELKATGVQSIRQTNGISAKKGWVFYDFQFEGASCAIYGKNHVCPHEIPILAVDTIVETLAQR